MTELQNNFILYTNNNHEIKVNVLLENDTIWMNQRQLAALYGVESNTITYHIQEIFKTGELLQDPVTRKIRVTGPDGKAYLTNHYNLDMIISIGYRVNSKQATQFRIWATKTLNEFIKKGFVLDDDRLKNNSQLFDKDYFDELLDRIRSIRASERRIYQKITDIFAECSTDYDPNSQTTKDFYAGVQNKFHFAIHGKTAPELILEKSDKTKSNMGLKTWKNSPEGRILKSDVTVGKNYLEEKEIKALERTISSFFDYIERIIENKNKFDMKTFAESVDKFLSFNEYKVLDGLGKVSKNTADKKAVAEYDEFNKTQKIESDFDKLTKKLKT